MNIGKNEYQSEIMKQRLLEIHVKLMELSAHTAKLTKTLAELQENVTNLYVSADEP